jgi:hypothetical protein
MVRESASGSRTPEGPDAFSPTTQLATFADDEALWNNVIVRANAAARNALAVPELRDGILVIQEDDWSIWLCTDATGPTWVRRSIPQDPFAEAAGVATTVGAAGSGSSAPVFWSGIESVVFPVGRFTVAPRVVATPAGNATGTVLPGVQIHDITTAGFTYRIMRIGAAPPVGTTMHWRAVQMASGAASG